MLQRAIILPGLAAILAMGVVMPASAVELVSNGGFETGDFAGWTQFGGPGQTNVNTIDRVSGTYGARFSPNTPGGIVQTLATIAGASYNINFDLRHFALPNLVRFPPANDFVVTFDGVVLNSLSDVANLPAGINPLLPLQPWVSFSYSAIASGPATVLEFTFRDNRQGPRNRWSIDNISVTGRGRTLGAVPEPASWMMLLTGFGLVGYAARRSRNALPAVTA